MHSGNSEQPQACCCHNQCCCAWHVLAGSQQHAHALLIASSVYTTAHLSYHGMFMLWPTESVRQSVACPSSCSAWSAGLSLPLTLSCWCVLLRLHVACVDLCAALLAQLCLADVHCRLHLPLAGSLAVASSARISFFLPGVELLPAVLVATVDSLTCQLEVVVLLTCRWPDVAWRWQCKLACCPPL